MLQKTDAIQPDVENTTAEAPAKRGAFYWLVKFLRIFSQFILMAAILYGGYFFMNRMIEAKEVPSKRPPFKTVYTVDTVVAKSGNYQPSMVVYGEVQAAKTVDLRSLVGGQIVNVSPNLLVGGRVEKGEVLFEVDKFNFETAMSGAKSTVIETRARVSENEALIAVEEARINSLREQLKLAQSDLKRIKQLKNRGSATERAVEERELIVSQRAQALEQSQLNLIVQKSRVEQLKAVLARAERGVVEAERNLQDTSLLAPMTGVIRENNAAVGRLISVNDMVVSMYRDDKLDVRFTLTDQRFGRIQSDKQGVIGREVEIIWVVGGEEFRYRATIERISAQITSDRGGVEVIASITDNIENNALRPGAFVEVIVPDKSFEGNYRIPETALYNNDTVYVSIDGELAARNVKVLARDGDAIIVDGAIKDGDIILVTRIAEISEGLKVRPPETAQTGTAQ
jgi:RND family efflux transporter MFP subunit